MRIVSSLVAWITLLALAVGCGAPSETSGRPADPPASESTVYAEYRAGVVQVQGVIDGLAESVARLQEASKKEGAEVERLDEAVGFLESAGESLGEFGEDPPTKREFEAKLVEFDEKRLACIQACNDALLDVASAKGVLEGTDPNLIEPIDTLVEDLREAIASLGGKPEEGVPTEETAGTS